jgi:anti-anti-sigma factor
MALQISEHEIESIEVLECRGRLTFGQEDLQFRNEVGKLVQAGKVNVALNLGQLSEIDTTGLGTLLYLVVKVRKAGGRLALFNLNAKHLELLVLMKLRRSLRCLRISRTQSTASFLTAR